MELSAARTAMADDPTLVGRELCRAYSDLVDAWLIRPVRDVCLPRVVRRIRPFPVLQIATGATAQTSGQYSFTISGANPDEVYGASKQLLGKLYGYPGFASFEARPLTRSSASG